MARKQIKELIEELRSWLPNYDHGPKDFPTVLYRVLAALPGGDELEDLGYEPIGNVGWKEAELLGQVLEAIQNKRDVEDLVKGLTSGDEEEEEEEEEVNEVREDDDTSTESHELTLFTTNDGDIYRRTIQPIIKNLARKVANGTYSKELAVKAWMYAADAGAQKYTKEHGGSGNGSFGSFSKADRMEAAREIGEHFDEEVQEEASKLKPARSKRR